MTYILIGGAVLVVLWLLSNAPRKAAKEEAAAKQHESVTNDRIAALMDELRRNPPPGSKVTQMSDAELKDYIATHIREYNQKNNFAGGCIATGIVLCLIGVFFIVFARNVVPDWAYLLVLAGIAAAGLGIWGITSTNRAYAALGLDPERLRIDAS